MLNYFLKRINNRKGFTLVELIVVISILGVLAAIAVPKFADQTQAAKNVANEANKRTLTGVAAMYIAEIGIPATGESNVEWDGTGSDEGWEKYLHAWPKHPEGEESKKYEVVITAGTGAIEVKEVEVTTP